MVVLDLMTKAERAKNYASDEIIVAHFDHGIRSNSGEDAEFVRKMAEEIYHETNITEKGKLGPDTSEETAREARYEFLRKVAREHEPATIYTAHHLDDLIESVAINLLRGTGWRGLAVLDTAGIRRPLLEAEICYEPMDKLAILEYAAKRGLRFREDPTNSSEQFLRNRVRARLEKENWNYEQKLEMWELWRKQKQLRREIDQLVVSLLPQEGEPWQRKWFQELEERAIESSTEDSTGETGETEEAGELWRNVARELLRAGLLRAGVRATRPQIEDFRRAILEYAPGKCFNLPGDKLVRLGKTEFELE